MHVYVLTGLVDGRVKAQEVLTDKATANARFERMKRTYGGANACKASRFVDDLSAFPPPETVEPNGVCPVCGEPHETHMPGCPWS